MRLGLLIALSLSAAPAHAAVKSSSAAGFEVENKAMVPVLPVQAYTALVRVGEWWSGAHTYSGNAANMTIDARPGGCFCEAWDGNAVEHLRVVLVQPGSMLRLQGGLGPLQAEAASGTLTWSLKAVGGGTEITQTYVVGGFVRGGAEKMAAVVDTVLAEQLARLRDRLGGTR